MYCTHAGGLYTSLLQIQSILAFKENDTTCRDKNESNQQWAKPSWSLIHTRARAHTIHIAGFSHDCCKVILILQDTTRYKHIINFSFLISQMQTKPRVPDGNP